MRVDLANVSKWSDKARRNRNLVVADAAQGLFADMSQRQPSIKETGTFEIGKVPVDESLLINSLFTMIGGNRVGDGPDSYVAALVGYEGGDTIMFAFSQDYAVDVEYGTVNMDGRFMRREAINGQGGWQARVDLSAAKFPD